MARQVVKLHRFIKTLEWYICLFLTFILLNTIILKLYKAELLTIKELAHNIKD